MSPTPAELFGRATRFQQEALARRGTRANPAYLAADVDLLTVLVRQASDALKVHGPVEDPARFVAENILGLHIDNPPERSRP